MTRDHAIQHHRSHRADAALGAGPAYLGALRAIAANLGVRSHIGLIGGSGQGGQVGARIATPYLPALVPLTVAHGVLTTTKWGKAGGNASAVTLVGSLLMLQVHSLLRRAEVLHIRAPWQFAPYNSAERFWTVR